ncbi:MAG: acyltransferase family protein [Desulfobacterales bacterium]|nr:MAG: acyltransferase family protein [Desulfobacterales bacterium]
MSSSAAAAAQRPARRHDLDWLRVLAVLVLLFFHAGRLFDRWPWHLKNEVLSEGITRVNLFITIWLMPLFFLLSGAASRFALKYRTGREYVQERFFRLFVPLVFGIFVIVPPQVYCERLFRNQFNGSFLGFYPHIFEGVYPAGNFSWHHLWFLAYLFVFSLLALPLFIYLGHNRKPLFLIRLLARIEKPWGLMLLPALPLAAYEALLRPFWPQGDQNLVNDWANFFFYITVFIYGYLLIPEEGIKASIERQGGRAVTLGLVSAVMILTYYFSFIPLKIDPLFGGVADLLYRIVWGFSCWFWLVAILSLGSRYLRMHNDVLRYSNEAVLPFYILHQTVIVVIGYFVFNWDLGVGGKYIFLSLASLLASIVIYAVIVRRFTPTRFLFGMRLQ